MGIRVVFPVGARVCKSRSGDAPRGFYAWYGATVSGCPERGDIDATYMGVSSHWNALDYTSPNQEEGDCQPLSPGLRGFRLAIAGHASVACQRIGPRGALEVWIYALAGKPSEQGGPPRTVYYAFLGTHAGREQQDMPRFEQFLTGIEIGR
ncbi:MAG: hypothetical protein JWP49_309 [Phenylobacterium sp.]|nr:hypothetical protein [Phenylobacterium sp.]